MSLLTSSLRTLAERLPPPYVALSGEVGPFSHFIGEGLRIQRSHAYATKEAANEALNVGWKRLQDAVREGGPVDGDRVRLVEYDPLGFVGKGKSEVGEFKPFLLTCGVEATLIDDETPDDPRRILKDAKGATATMKCEIQGNEDPVEKTADVDLQPLTKEETPLAGTLNALELILLSDTSSQVRSYVICRKWLGKDDVLQSSTKILKLMKKNNSINDFFFNLENPRLLSGRPFADINDETTKSHVCRVFRESRIGDWIMRAVELLASGHDRIQLLAVDNVEWMKRSAESATQSASRRIKDFRIKRKKRRQLGVKSSKRSKLVNGKEGKRLRRAKSAAVRKR